VPLLFRREFLLAGASVALGAGFARLALAAEPRLSKSEWQAIKNVISQQLAALKAGNADKAFSYAAPGIRAQFGDAATFIAMVREAYSPLLLARYTEFLEGAVIDGMVIQPLRLIGSDNTVRVALYTMEKQENGIWRISGCRVAPSTVQAT
jgi:ABC-type molybdate transport system substrate-binding protein